MIGKFAVFLAPNTPQDLLTWAVMDDGPPFLSCTELEDAVAGMVRLRVQAPASDPPQVATLLVHAGHIAWVLDGHKPPRPGFF